MPIQPHTCIEKLFGFPLVEFDLALIAKSVSKYSWLILKKTIKN
jgi:hypothetical protein